MKRFTKIIAAVTLLALSQLAFAGIAAAATSFAGSDFSYNSSDYMMYACDREADSHKVKAEVSGVDFGAGWTELAQDTDGSNGNCYYGSWGSSWNFDTHKTCEIIVFGPDECGASVSI